MVICSKRKDEVKLRSENEVAYWQELIILIRKQIKLALDCAQYVESLFIVPDQNNLFPRRAAITV